MTIPSGYYTKMQDIVDAMNAQIEDRLTHHTFPVINQQGQRSLTKIEPDKWPKIKYNEVKKRIHIYLQAGAFVTFDDHMETLLGIKANPLVNRFPEPKWISGTTATDIGGGIHSLYVYCDVLESVPVGDTQAPLLRIVDATGSHSANVHRTFEQPRYMPVQKKHFDSIEVLIRDDTGEPVSFEGGKLVVTLHFCRALTPYFSS
jgi:hypothetical protein